MSDCIHEDRIIELVKATEANTVQVNNLTKSMGQMQKWIMGFIISTLLVVVGMSLNTYLSPTQALAKEMIKNERIDKSNKVSKETSHNG